MSTQTDPSSMPGAALGPAPLQAALPASGWDVLDRLNLPVMIVEPGHTIVYANPAARTVFSGLFTQLEGNACFRALLNQPHACGQNGCECLLQDLWDNSTPVTGVHEVRQPDGTLQLKAITAVALPNAGGGPPQAVVTFQDVTSQLQLERCMRHVLQGTGNTTGLQYLRALAKHLSQALNVETALVGRYLPGQQAIHTLAYYSDGRQNTPFTYAMAGAPCAQVVLGAEVCVEQGACLRYPDEPYFARARIESYAGAPLYSSNGTVAGLLAVNSSKPFPAPELVQVLLRTFAARAAGELERMDSETNLRQAQASLEQEIARRTAALRESQERYQLLFNSGSDAVMVFRVERLPDGQFAPGRFVAANDIAVKRYGYSREELLDLTPYVLNTPTGAINLPKLLNELQRRGRGLYQVEHITKHGRRFPVEINVQLLELDGKPVAQATVRDISERLAAEAALRQSEDRFRSIIENTPVGMCIIDEQGCYEYLNPSFCDIFGYSADELLGLPLSTAVRSDRKPILQAAHHNVLYGEGRFRGELELDHKSGSPLTVLIDAIRITGADGRGKAVAFAIDMTASKHTQEAVRQMALLAELSPEPIIRFDRKGTVLLANSASNMVFQQADCLGRGLPALAPELAGFDFAACINGAGLSNLTCTVGEHTYRLTIRGVPELGIGQLYATDITATVKAMQKAQGASQAKSQFLANMSHELRTPLSAINGFSEVLLEQGVGPLASQQQDYVRRINQSGQHLLSLINDLLDLAKIEAGKLVLAKEDLDLRLVCHEACDLISGRVQHRRLALFRDLPGQPAPYYGDRLRLRQVLINLLSNAVKFTQEGSITVKLETRPQQYKLSVRDTGIGIEQEKLSRLFQRFEQVHDPAQVDDSGTGLGLSLCREIVAAHGGSIGVESAPGVGSVFTVNLPCTGQP